MRINAGGDVVRPFTFRWLSVGSYICWNSKELNAAGEGQNGRLSPSLERFVSESRAIRK